MSRNICVCLNFLEEEHKQKIQKAAADAGFDVRFFSSEEEALPFLQECEILYAHSPSLLRAAPATLQWYCCAYAGVDPYCADPTLFANPNCILTNSNCYGVTISEHVIMVLLMMMRQMPQYQQIVRDRQWISDLPIRSIWDNQFTILGTGNIGINVAKRLRAMGAANIVGVSRSGKPVEDIFNEVYPISQLDEVLKCTSNLIMALPGTAETTYILNGARIALLPEGAYVVNVGRGSAVEQEALAAALESGHLAGAALDVMAPEPLPQDHFLWTTKNLILTPHVSGNMTLGYTRDLNVEMFCQDLANYAAGRPLQGFVDRNLGY